MPSIKKRLPLTLPDDVSAALQELASAVGKPVATVATELLKEMAPQMHHLATVARAMKAGNQELAKTAMRHMVGDAAVELMQANQPDMFVLPAKKAARKAPARKAARK